MHLHLYELCDAIQQAACSVIRLVGSQGCAVMDMKHHTPVQAAVGTDQSCMYVSLAASASV